MSEDNDRVNRALDKVYQTDENELPLLMAAKFVLVTLMVFTLAATIIATPLIWRINL